jgi:DNA repair protein RecN (Recombination protein N)
MLRYLSIRNFALIDQLEIEFGEGLNLFTGETGSGKSILVDAVGLLLGRRASQEMIREGFRQSRVEGIFSVTPGNPARGLLYEQGIDLEAEELIVRREIATSGTNKVFINGVLSTQGFLFELGAHLADIHGQHDQQKLLQPRDHLRFLDAFHKDRQKLGKVADLYREWTKVRDLLSAAYGNEQERLRAMDNLRYQIREIDDLGLTPDLDAELAAQRQLLSTAEKRLEASSNAYHTLYERDHSILEEVDKVARQLQLLKDLDPGFSQSEGKMLDVRYRLEEISFELRDYSDSIEFDPVRLDAVEERLATLHQAQRKYGSTARDILDYRTEIGRELSDLEAQGEQMGSLEEQNTQLQQDYLQACRELSEVRRSGSEQLCRRVERELMDLAMSCTFRVNLESHPEDPSEQGIDTAEFLISANPGESPKALARIASGGELSRIILALKSILTLEEYPKTLIFDEIDAGLGGRVASALGDRLVRLAIGNQVFCVTHLPQIAALASHHYFVAKTAQKGRTKIQVRRLDDRQRVEELARMLAGRKVTEAALRQAEELLRTESEAT